MQTRTNRTWLICVAISLATAGAWPKTAEAKRASCDRNDVFCQGVAGGDCRVGADGNLQVGNKVKKSGNNVKTGKVSKNTKKCVYETALAGEDFGVDLLTGGVGTAGSDDTYTIVAAPRFPLGVSFIPVGERTTLALDFTVRLAWVPEGLSTDSRGDGPFEVDVEPQESLIVTPSLEVTFLNQRLSPSIFLGVGFHYEKSKISSGANPYTRYSTSPATTFGGAIHHQISDRFLLRLEAGVTTVFGESREVLGDDRSIHSTGGRVESFPSLLVGSKIRF